MNRIKNELIRRCEEILGQKESAIQSSIQQAQDSLFNETKSSAGDKYETSREMIQQDLDRLNRQLVEVNKDRLILSQLSDDPLKINQVLLGSLVKTNGLTYFLAIGVGKLTVQSKDIYVISIHSPIAKALLGLKVEDYFTFNNAEQQILSIY